MQYILFYSSKHRRAMRPHRGAGMARPLAVTRD